MDPSAVNPEIDDQGAELSLIAALIPELENPSAIDVGSERGAVAAVLRDAGAGPMWLVEPFPGSVALLLERFADVPGVHVLDVAAGGEDRAAELHLAHDESGESLDAFHTLHPESSGPDLAWRRSVPVRVRSLDSLSAAGEIPSRVGVLKVDAEGSDAEVLRGAASLTADIVMVEFWGELPDTLGKCPFTLGEVRSLVEPLGLERFLFVRHGPRHVSIGRWDTADPGQGEWGNLIFMADSLVGAAEAALPALDRALRERSERIIAEQEAAAAERLETIGRLKSDADERLELIENLSSNNVNRDVKRLRVGRRGKRRRRSELPALDPLDDVEQEGRGSSPV
ncbi:MAG TPA: FkbM family methyltransferase [Solirubrobacterales bacterium]|nr:FkbM family methyltransferase [Solirubrobacterales bacterium]